MFSVASNPELFFGSQPADVLLRPPEPQYLMANLLYLCLAGAELKSLGGPFGISADRAATSSGMPVPSFEEWQLKLADDPIRDAFLINMQMLSESSSGAAVQAIKSKTVQFSRPKFLSGTYTLISRVVNPAVDISTTPVELTHELATLTLGVYAGVHDGVSVKPIAVNVLDSPGARVSLTDESQLHFERDRTKLLDSALNALFAGCTTNIVYPLDTDNALTSASVDTAFLSAGDRPMDLETVYRIAEKLKQAGIPAFANGKYILVLGTRAMRQLKTDPAFRNQRIFIDSINPLVSGTYRGTIENIDIYESATVVSTTNAASPAVTYYKNFAFGPGSLGYAPGIYPHIRFSTTDNYALSPKGIWLSVEAMDILDNRFVVACWTD